MARADICHDNDAQVSKKEIELLFNALAQIERAHQRAEAMRAHEVAIHVRTHGSLLSATKDAIFALPVHTAHICLIERASARCALGSQSTDDATAGK